MSWFIALVLVASALEPVIQHSSRPMSENVAAKIIKNKSIQLKLTLRKCKDERVTSSRFVKDDASMFWFAELPADSSFDYTACSANSQYMSQYLLLYCKKTRKLHEIRHFQPSASFTPSRKPRYTCESIVRI